MDKEKASINENKLSDVSGGNWQDVVLSFRRKYDALLRSQYKNGPDRTIPAYKPLGK